MIRIAKFLRPPPELHRGVGQGLGSVGVDTVPKGGRVSQEARSLTSAPPLGFGWAGFSVPGALVLGHQKGYRKLRREPPHSPSSLGQASSRELEDQQAFGKALFEGDEGFGGAGHGGR